MEGKEAIIADIIEKAEIAAAALTADAREEYNETVERVRADESRRQSEAVAAARESAQALLARRQTLCALETRKAELAAKQKVIDAAYEEAAHKILNMTDHIYREFVGNMVEKYADDGDEIVVAERDCKRLHDEWLTAIARKTGKNLAFSNRTHSGRGGVILVGKSCDKNLTLETLLGSLREDSLAGVATRLFGK
ncbi:MAG: hypothetical protein HFE47_03475 [Clostridia bacterium]|nr:hypothetical protein [Clostridia bacterium]